MSHNTLPFLINGRRAGTVCDVSSQAEHFRGRLTLDGCDERALFEAVVALARDVDAASPAAYQEAWYAWAHGCEEFNDLNISIGEANGGIEDLNVDSDWTIEWEQGFVDQLEIWD